MWRYLYRGAYGIAEIESTDGRDHDIVLFPFSRSGNPRTLFIFAFPPFEGVVPMEELAATLPRKIAVVELLRKVAKPDFEFFDAHVEGKVVDVEERT